MNNIKYYIFIIIVFLSVLIYADDIIYVKNGDEYKGILKEINTDTISFVQDNTLRIMPVADINKIRISNLLETESITVHDINDTLLKSVVNKYQDYETTTADYTVLYSSTNIKMNIDRTLCYTYRKIIKIHTEEGKYAAAQQLQYNKLIEKVKLNFGRTIKPDNNVTILSQSGIEEGSIYGQYKEYDNINNYKFVLKETAINTIIDFSYTVYYKKISSAQNGYTEIFFQEKYPVKEYKCIISCPRKININYNLKNNKSIIVNKFNTNETQYLEFTGNDIPAYKQESLMPPGTIFLPHLQVSFGYNWDAIKKSIQTEQKSNKSLLKYIPKKMIEPNLQNLHYLYNFITREIKFVNTPLNILLYKHLPPEKIMVTKYANQYDKQYIFYLMLRELGFRADMLLCRQQQQGRLNPNIPSLDQFNSVLVKVNIENETYYLNPIHENIPFGYISDNYQNIQVFNVTNSAIKFEFIPYQNIDNELHYRKIDVSLSKAGDLSGTYILYNTGIDGIDLKYLKYYNKEKISKYLSTYINYYSNKNVILRDFIITDLNESNKYPKITAYITIPGFAQVIGTKYLLWQLPFVSFSAGTVSENERQYPLYFKNRSQNEYYFKLTIPDGYKIDYKPDILDIKIANHFFSNKITEKNNILEYKHSYIIDEILCSREYYHSYKHFIETLSRYQKEWFVLK